jgi:hypothetical protein
MNTTEFNIYWDSHFPDCPPVAHWLRHAYRDRWFRIHALPQSKRYPETAAEYAEVLRRHNVILTDLLLVGQPFALLTAGYSSTQAPVPPEGVDPRYGPQIFMRSVLYDEDEEYGNIYWHIWICQHLWEPGTLDPLLVAVADDSIENVLIVDPHQSVVYHPYDGGADIILKTCKQQDHCRIRYKDWLSSHPSGL